MGESLLCLEAWGGQGSKVCQARASLAASPFLSYHQESAPHMVFRHPPSPLPLRGCSPHRPYSPKVTPSRGSQPHLLTE